MTNPTMDPTPTNIPTTDPTPTNPTTSPTPMNHARLDGLHIEGTISCTGPDIELASTDFGNSVRYHDPPLALIRPSGPVDICKVVRYANGLAEMGVGPGSVVAARGNGHSIYGQAQAPNGLVLDMRSLKSSPGSIRVRVRPRDVPHPYVDASGGDLWIDVLHECLKHGMAPRSWTDYLYLTVGGTIQVGGVGGQTFKFGPIINNVMELEVITGKGELQVCSATQNAELFFAMLGGLGQFGIITRARIVLAKAPRKVRWIRMIYGDVGEFTHDQEQIIVNEMFDFVEGFVVCNNNDPVNGWGQVAFTLDDSDQLDDFANRIPPDCGPILYCLELAKYYNDDDDEYIDNTILMDEVVEKLQSSLRYIRGLSFSKDVSYVNFLNRVHAQEVALTKLGMWQSSHPWLCLFVPRSHIKSLDTLIFKSKLVKGVGGPMHMYPMLKNKWVEHSCAITPNEDIFYLVNLLRLHYPPSKEPKLETLLQENDEILHALESDGIPFKVYMPRFKSPQDSQLHFGHFWQHFLYLKQTYDPFAVLAPGQCIFPWMSSRDNSRASIT